MPDYKSLYFKLFSAQAKVIELLQKAGLEAENLVMEDDCEPLTMVDTRQSEEV